MTAAGGNTGGLLVNTWTYHDADGTEVMRVGRFDLPDGSKQFRPVHLAGDGWKIGDLPGKLPLYRLPDIPAEGTICVTEGEKCADAAASIGLASVTSSHGSSSAGKTDWTRLSGRDVVILPDADAAGEKYGRDVVRILVALDPPARVKILLLPDLADGGDIADWLMIDGRDCREPAELRAEIEALAAGVPTQDAASIIGGPVLICMADVQPCEVKWLWPGRIPLGRISLLVGRPGEGKSFATTDVAARVSTGAPWPDGSGNAPRGSVIFICAEDDPADTIRPRLDAHHADVSRVKVLAIVRRFDDDGKPHDVMFTLADLASLKAALIATPDCVLIVIDPIGSFLGGSTDAHRDNAVRSVLAPVAALAAKYGPAVLIVMHRRKSAGDTADDTALGSRAFTGIARAVWHLSRDPKNKSRRLLLAGKCNLSAEGSGLAFSIGGTPPAICWEKSPVAMSADDAMEGERDERGRPADERRDAADWLQSELADLQEHPADDLRKAATEAGIVWRTLQRAADALEVRRHRPGFGKGFVWRLPKPGTPPADADAIRATYTCQNAENENSGTNGTNENFPNKTGGFDVPESHTCHNDLCGTNGAETPSEPAKIGVVWGREPEYPPIPSEPAVEGGAE